jgi:hypothetical protein
MELRNFFRNSSNKTYNHNMDLLEHFDLVNPLGSPNALFLKFLKSKNLDIKKDAITAELIEEFENSIDSTNLRLEKIRREKEAIFNDRRVWINVCRENRWVGSDLLLDSDGITIQLTGERISYSDITDIEIHEGGWSKNRFIIYAKDSEAVFEINENKAVPLKEIIEDNIENQRDEIDELLSLYALFEDGEISKEEFEIRKAIIYSDDEYCTNCGVKLEEGSEFCTNCGHRISD